MEKFIKWISNYWYHYKFRTILCLFLAVVLIFSVCQLITREKYDMKVYFYTSNIVPADAERALETTIEEVFSENGEEKNVQVINLSYNPYSVDGEARMSYAAALAGELRMKKDFLYITDKYRIEELLDNEVFQNVFIEKETFDKYDNKAYLINGKDFEKRFTKNLEKNKIEVQKMPKLYISLLNPSGVNDKTYKKYQQAEKLVDLIIKNDKNKE